MISQKVKLLNILFSNAYESMKLIIYIFYIIEHECGRAKRCKEENLERSKASFAGSAKLKLARR